MARPVTISDEVILRIAQRVFSQGGFKASTLQIAREAGVSEATLFKRFKTKAQLFLEAMHHEASESEWMKELMTKVGHGSVRENLILAGARIIQHLENSVPRMMALRTSGLRMPHPSQLKHRPPFEIYADILTDYFTKEMALGRLAISQPAIHSQMIIGALMHYVISTQHAKPFCSREDYLPFLIDLHLGSQGKPQRSSR